MRQRNVLLLLCLALLSTLKVHAQSRADHHRRNFRPARRCPPQW